MTINEPLKEWEKKILTITGESPDKKYVNLLVGTAEQVNRVFELGRETGLSNEEIVNPQYKKYVFKNKKTQFLHIHSFDLQKKFFFTRRAMDAILKLDQ